MLKTGTFLGLKRPRDQIDRTSLHAFRKIAIATLCGNDPCRLTPLTFALILSGSHTHNKHFCLYIAELKARLSSQQRISTHHSNTSQAEMDNNLFHFDFDNDDINTDHNPSTTTNTTTTTMPGGGHSRKKLITRPNRNDVLGGRG